MRDKQGKQNDKGSRGLHMIWRVTILVYIVVLLYFLVTCGGNGANWFPGKPIYTR
ncbi:MAG: hypothetical protein ACN6O7_15385 [Sphingobacterium sp.]